jgi:hypothetical protein
MLIPADGRFTTLSSHRLRGKAVIQIDLDERNEADQRRRGSDPARPSDHSMILSARSSAWGIVRPSALAVLRLIDSTNLVGC